MKASILNECVAKRIYQYGSNPWAIIHVPTGQRVQGPAEGIDHPDLGKTMIQGPSLFRRKRDAQAALDSLRRSANSSCVTQEVSMCNEKGGW